MATILLLQGPNLNMLGRREPHLYGSVDLPALHNDLESYAADQHISIECFQSNSEADLINKIHDQFESDCQFLIMNPGAFTHTSIALRDAVLSVNLPLIEVHISNIYRREPFRHHSYFSDIAVGLICGLGLKGYFFAIDYAVDHLKKI